MMPAVKNSNVNHPTHYNTGRIEVIDIIKDQLTREQYIGFCKGNVIKYILRADNKNGIEDYAKAVWYINRLKDQQHE